MKLIKEKIVENQIALIKEFYGNCFNYDELKCFLYNGFEYSKSVNLINQKIDWNLMDKFEKQIMETSHRTRVAGLVTKLQNSFEWYFNNKIGTERVEFTNKEALKLYFDKDALSKVRNFGQGSKEMLGKYLKEIGIIEKQD